MDIFRFVKLFALIGIASLHSPVSAQQPIASYMSLKQYQELEQGATDKTKGSPLVTIYIGGAIEALGIANAKLEKTG